VNTTLYVSAIEESVAEACWFQIVRPFVRPLSGRPMTVVLPLTSIASDAVSLYLVDGFQWNFAWICTTWVSIDEKVRCHSHVKIMTKLNARMAEACILKMW